MGENRKQREAKGQFQKKNKKSNRRKGVNDISRDGEKIKELERNLPRTVAGNLCPWKGNIWTRRGPELSTLLEFISVALIIRISGKQF